MRIIIVLGILLYTDASIHFDDIVLQPQYYYCQACTTTIEAVHRKVAQRADSIQGRFSEGVRSGVGGEVLHLDIMSIILGICNTPEFSRHREDIKYGCNHFVKHSAELIGVLLSGATLEHSDCYERSYKFCSEKVNVCPKLDKKNNHWLTYYNNSNLKNHKNAKIMGCASCRLLVFDMERVISRDFGNSRFRSRSHVWQVIEDECISISLRYPRYVSSHLQSVCDDIVENYEEIVAHSLLKKVVVPESVKKTIASFNLQKIYGEEAYTSVIASIEAITAAFDSADLICGKVSSRCSETSDITLENDLEWWYFSTMISPDIVQVSSHVNNLKKTESCNEK